MFGAGLLFPLYFQIGRHQSVLATGLLLISLSAGTALVLPWSGRLVDRHGGGIVSVYGGVAAVVTTVPFALLDTHTNHVVVQLLLLARGMAIALAVMPATTAAYKAVTTAQLPDATTQVNILLRVGGALGGAIFAVVLAAARPDGVDGAFRTAFWWLTAASTLGLAAAAWLTAAERRASRHSAHRRTQPSQNDRAPDGQAAAGRSVGRPGPVPPQRQRYDQEQQHGAVGEAARRLGAPAASCGRPWAPRGCRTGRARRPRAR